MINIQNHWYFILTFEDSTDLPFKINYYVKLLCKINNDCTRYDFQSAKPRLAILQRFYFSSKKRTASFLWKIVTFVWTLSFLLPSGLAQVSRLSPLKANFHAARRSWPDIRTIQREVVESERDEGRKQREKEQKRGWEKEKIDTQWMPLCVVSPSISPCSIYSHRPPGPRDTSLKSDLQRKPNIHGSVAFVPVSLRSISSFSHQSRSMVAPSISQPIREIFDRRRKY